MNEILQQIITIVIGLVCTMILAFASHRSKSLWVRVLFWICLAFSLCIIIWSGVSNIQSSGKLEVLEQDMTSTTSTVAKIKSDLTEKEQTIRELEEKAKQAAQGVTATYYLNGTIRKTYGSEVRADKHLVPTYNRMVELQNDKNFGELAVFCEEQIKKNPEWVTPHVFLGVAAANLGDIAKACRAYQHFLDNAPSEPSYGYSKARIQANQLLTKLKNQRKDG